MKILLVGTLITQLLLVAEAVELTSGQYICDYEYKDSDKVQEKSLKKFQIVASDEQYIFELEEEVLEANNPIPYQEFLPFLEFPKKGIAELRKHYFLNFDAFFIKWYFQTKNYLRINFLFEGHWYNNSKNTISLRKHKNESFKLRWKSVDKDNKFSSLTKLRCQLEIAR